MSRQYIEITEEMCGAVANRQIPVPGTIDTLKKVWKHFCKATKRMDNVNVYACVVTEDGKVEDWSMYWCCSEMEHMCNSGAIPFCC